VIPTFQDIMVPLLELLSKNNSMKLKSIEDELPASGLRYLDKNHHVRTLILAPEERSKTAKNGQSVLYTNITWALSDMKKAGLVEQKERGEYSITEKGIHELKSTSRITRKYLATKYGTGTSSTSRRRRRIRSIESGHETEDEGYDTQRSQNQNPNKFTTQHASKAGEFRVASELLLRKYNVSLTALNEGVDIIAHKSGAQYKVKVKTAEANPDGKYIVSMKKSEFAIFYDKDAFCVFVLLQDDLTAKFLIMHASDIKRIAKSKRDDNDSFYVFVISDTNQQIDIGGMDVTYHLNNWEIE